MQTPYTVNRKPYTIRLISFLVAEIFFASSILPAWALPSASKTSMLRPTASVGASRNEDKTLKRLRQDLVKARDGGVRESLAALQDGSQEVRSDAVRALFEALKKAPDITSWDEVFEGFTNLPESERVNVSFLVDRGTYPFRTYDVVVPRLAIRDADQNPLVARYLATYLYNRLAPEGGKAVVTFVSDPDFEEEVASLVRQELTTRLGRAEVYANFGDSIPISSGRQFQLNIARTIEEPASPFNPNVGLTIGIDVGATNIKIAIIENGSRIYEQHVPVNHEEGGEAIVRQVEEQIHQAREALRKERGDSVQVDRIGLSFAAVLKERPYHQPRIVRMTNFERHWARKRGVSMRPIEFERDYEVLNAFPQRLRDEFGFTTVGVINDANAFGFQEVISQPGLHRGTVVVMPLGTGAGYVKIVDDQIEDLPHQGGHMVVDLRDDSGVVRRDLGCGHLGCFNAYASATALTKQLNETLGRAAPAVGGVPELDAQDLERVIGLLREMAGWIAVEVAELAKIIPDLNEVVLAAGVMQGLTGDEMIRIANEILSTRFPAIAARVKITLSQTDVLWGGAMGAAQYANWLNQTKPSDLTEGDNYKGYQLPEITAGKGIIQNLLKSLPIETAVVIDKELYAYIEAHAADFPWLPDLKQLLVLQIDRSSLLNLEGIATQLRATGTPMIVGMGAGTITDVAKFLGSTVGKQKRIPVVVIPTALSTNAPFTEKAIFYTTPTDGSRRQRLSIEVHPSQRAVFDLDFIRAFMGHENVGPIASERLNRSGAGDLLSIVTALHDWDLAIRHHREIRHAPGMRGQMARIVNELKAYAGEVKANSDLGWLFQIYAHAEASLVNMRYGSSRPKDGSEHLLADRLEEMMGDRPHLHGEMLGVAVPIMAELQQQPLLEVRGLVEALGLPVDPETVGLSRNQVVEALTDLHPRRDKYTIVDVHRLSRAEAGALVERVLGGVVSEEPVSPEVMVVEEAARAVIQHIRHKVIEPLDAEKAKELVRLLRQIRRRRGRVYLNAAGRSGELGMYFLGRLTELGVNAYRLQEVTNLDTLGPNDLVLSVSGSGRTASIVERVMHLARSENPPQMISLTASPGQHLWSEGNQIVIHIPGKTKIIEKQRVDFENILPLASTFEYASLLYLESVLRAFEDRSIKVNSRRIGEFLRQDMESTLIHIEQRVLPQISRQREETQKLINTLVRVESVTGTGVGGGETPADVMRKVTSWVEQGRPPFVFFFGLGRHHHTIRLFASRMRNIGFNVAVPAPDEISPRMKPGDVAFTVTLDGREPRLLRMLDVAQSLGNPALLVTAQGTSEAAQKATVAINILSEGIEEQEALPQAALRRAFELGSLIYLEGISVGLMRLLERTGQELEHTQNEFELRGPLAPASNPIIRHLIDMGQMAELTVEEDQLIAYRIQHHEGYQPGHTDVSEYRGEPLQVDALFTNDQQQALLTWIAEHHVRGAPVKFRVALDQAALGWQDDIAHSNIAHAGYRDQAIYIGQSLLQHLFTLGHEPLRTELLDRDELRHLQDENFSHDSEKDAYRARLETVGRAIDSIVTARDGGRKEKPTPSPEEMLRLQRHVEATEHQSLTSLQSFSDLEKLELSGKGGVVISDGRRWLTDWIPLRDRTQLSEEEQEWATEFFPALAERDPDLARLDPFSIHFKNFLRSMGWQETSADEMGLSLRSAIANAVVHGNRYSPNSPLFITWEILPSEISIRIYDQGHGGVEEGFARTLPESLPAGVETLGLAGEGMGIKRMEARGFTVSRQPVFEKEKRIGQVVTLVKPLATSDGGDRRSLISHLEHYVEERGHQAPVRFQNFSDTEKLGIGEKGSIVITDGKQWLTDWRTRFRWSAQEIEWAEEWAPPQWAENVPDTARLEPFSLHVKKRLREISKWDEGPADAVGISLTEAIKNAVVHGNNFLEGLPVFVVWEMAPQEISIWVYNLGLGKFPDSSFTPTPQELLPNGAKQLNLAGMGLGVKKIREAGFSIAHDQIVEKGRPIGTVVTLRKPLAASDGGKRESWRDFIVEELHSFPPPIHSLKDLAVYDADVNGLFDKFDTHIQLQNVLLRLKEEGVELDALRGGVGLIIGPGPKEDELVTALEELGLREIHAVDWRKDRLTHLAHRLDKRYPPGHPKRSAFKLYHEHAAHLREMGIKEGSVNFVYTAGVFDRYSKWPGLLKTMVEEAKAVTAPSGIMIFARSPEVGTYFEEHQLRFIDTVPAGWHDESILAFQKIEKDSLEDRLWRGHRLIDELKRSLDRGPRKISPNSNKIGMAREIVSILRNIYREKSTDPTFISQWSRMNEKVSQILKGDYPIEVRRILGNFYYPIKIDDLRISAETAKREGDHQQVVGIKEEIQLLERNLKTLNIEAKDGVGRQTEDRPPTFPEFSFDEGKEERGFGDSRYWRGIVRAGKTEFFIFVGSAGDSAYLELRDPSTQKVVASTEWWRGEKPWLQSIAVEKPEFRGPEAEVRLSDLIMAILLSDMAGYGSSFENLYSSVALRPEGDRLGSLGVFRSLERIGLRPDPELLTRWADRLKDGGATVEFRKQIRSPRRLREDAPHLRILSTGREFLQLGEEHEIELFLVRNDGRVISDGTAYQKLSADPAQVEKILREVAGGADLVTVEGAPYHVWVGGAPYKLPSERLPALQALITSIPPVPWTPEEGKARDGGTKEGVDAIYHMIHSRPLFAPMDGPAELLLYQLGDTTFHVIVERHLSLRAMNLIRDHIAPSAAERPAEWLFLIEQGDREVARVGNTETAFAYEISRHFNIPLRNPMVREYDVEANREIAARVEGLSSYKSAIGFDYYLTARRGLQRRGYQGPFPFEKRRFEGYSQFIGGVVTGEELEKIARWADRLSRENPSRFDNLVDRFWEAYGEVMNRRGQTKLRQLLNAYQDRKHVFILIGKGHLPLIEQIPAIVKLPEGTARDGGIDRRKFLALVSTAAAGGALWGALRDEDVSLRETRLTLEKVDTFLNDKWAPVKGERFEKQIQDRLRQGLLLRNALISNEPAPRMIPRLLALEKYLNRLAGGIGLVGEGLPLERIALSEEFEPWQVSDKQLSVFKGWLSPRSQEAFKSYASRLGVSEERLEQAILETLRRIAWEAARVLVEEKGWSYQGLPTMMICPWGEIQSNAGLLGTVLGEAREKNLSVPDVEAFFSRDKALGYLPSLQSWYRNTQNKELKLINKGDILSGVIHRSGVLSLNDGMVLWAMLEPKNFHEDPPLREELIDGVAHEVYHLYNPKSRWSEPESLDAYFKKEKDEGVLEGSEFLAREIIKRIGMVLPFQAVDYLRETRQDPGRYESRRNPGESMDGGNQKRPDVQAREAEAPSRLILEPFYSP